MFRYADPLVCPGCRSAMEYGAPQCASCGLPLTGSLAQRLFASLTHADTLVAQLRATAPAPVAVPAGPAGTAPTAEGPVTPLPSDHPPFPASPTSRVPHTGGLSAASVPKILLGLGATCLLVAALVFLAVAWSALGVGGRTGVLVLLTTAAAGTAAWLARQDLRAGAEAFTAVAVGLVWLDVIGADRAGWLGDPDASTMLLVTGLCVGAAGSAAALLARRTPVGTVVTGQLFGALGVTLAALGVATQPALDRDAGLVVGLVITAAGAYAAWRVRLVVAAAASSAAGLVWWTAIVAVGVLRIDTRSFAQVWLDLDILLLLVGTLVPALVALARPLPVPARVAAAGVAVALATLDLTLVAFDESTTTVSLTALGVVLVATALSTVLALPWRWVTVAPAVVAALVLARSALELLAEALDALLGYRAWGESLTAPVPVPDLPWSWPLLLPAGALAAMLTAWLVARCLLDLPARLFVAWLVPVLVGAIALVPVLYGVPLWVALLGLALGALVAAAAAAYSSRLEPLSATVVLGVLALLASFADEWSTAVALGLLTAGAGLAAFRGREGVALAGGVVLPPAGSGFVWTLQELAEVDLVWRALPILLLLGVFTIVRPGLEREVPSYAAGTVAAALSVLSPSGVDQSWLAVYLTLGGVVLTASALIHPDRRELSWGGLGLFTLAQWVRLEQLGVDTVEAYTLPLALVLLAVGALRLRSSDVSTHRALGAGLGLALVPSLLQMLVEPVSLRALLLGLACAALIGVGVALRWAAPLLAGAGVGLLLVLRESVHAQVLPQWMVIGLVGLGLTVVGVTWERRLAELRAAAGYVRALR
jgi:hypothetical protein